MADNKQRIQTIIKAIGIIFAVFLSIVIIYLAYVFLSYRRIDDNQKLTVNLPKQQSADFDSSQMPINKTYTVGTYNVGFGAYLPDYSFLWMEVSTPDVIVARVVQMQSKVQQDWH